ncbi:YggS family pyridoxal phosphate-dependent enzyme [Thiomicrorhabdus xiamenensis]|uniref:Pyridoxal phosphate homeostasis protein n=1 Tax=Thiomicrorhabdus xiamenensis TaxID=2739063 RepID=A0A7D4SZD7_9GAMM|nr:YggS family pyridoxal phosphate-dependent enzyme [Thiomicrorhabdus xiamenensis]QKI88502.1 YggS family pyridoxal phosphate-dependent enzyme [Thiomicrorhabdus xiamenensis]
MSLPHATPQRQQQLQENFQKVEQRIEEACHEAGRPRESVQLLAVSKTKPLEDILSLAAIGQQAFGENYLQEALDKIAQAPELEWHFIGPIQSNKTRPIAENFAWVHSVDRLKIARRLSEQRPPNAATLKILLEINLDEESSKAGFNEQDIEDAVSEVLQMPHIELRGLMAIPMIRSDFEGQRAVFRRLKKLLGALQKKFPDARLDTLSMGMSGDLEAAIMEGATWIRIGTDLFGARDYGSKS